VAIWVAGLSLLTTACGADDPIGDPVDATVGIRASGCSLVDRLGTGAVVLDGDRTVVVTSAHTVAGSDTIVVERAERQTAVELLALDTERDLAILTAPGWSAPGRTLAAPTTGEPARIAVWGPDTPISVADTEVTSLGPGTNTTLPIPTRPVGSTPRSLCHRSTTVAVTAVKVWSTVISPSVS
jgi:hypothetical protein